MAIENANVPPREVCVLPAMLDDQAGRRGDKPLILFEGDEAWTYAEARTVGRRTAAALQALGIRRGEPVLVWLPSTSTIVPPAVEPRRGQMAVMIGVSADSYES